MRVWQYKIYLARHLGMSLTDIGQVPAGEFYALVAEVEYQRRIEEYPLLYNLGQIMCILSNDKLHKRQPQDFVGNEPRREVRRRMVKKRTYDVVLSDGQTYTLSILNVNMMEAIEEEFDKAWEDLFTNPRIKVVKSLLWQMLLPNYPDMTKDHLGNLVTAKELPNLTKIITGMSDG